MGPTQCTEHSEWWSGQVVSGSDGPRKEVPGTPPRVWQHVDRIGGTMAAASPDLARSVC
jgi:hypothetical protein